jgi:plastocyanin
VMVRASTIVLVAFSVFLLAACSSPSGSSGGSGATTVTGTDYKFDPANVTVKVNQPATVTLRNTSTQVHDWTVQGLDKAVTGQAAGGQSATITFTPTKTGTFKVICNQPGHEQLGMVGQLIVQ